MLKKITDSLEWAEVEDYLKTRSFNLKHSKEVNIMIRNLRNKVVELSKAEVEKRRGRSNNVASLLDVINNDIEMIEGYILMATLIG